MSYKTINILIYNYEIIKLIVDFYNKTRTITGSSCMFVFAIYIVVVDLKAFLVPNLLLQPSALKNYYYNIHIRLVSVS